MEKEVILITGGAGFIGSHCVNKLLENGHKVVVIDNFSTGSRANLAEFFDNDHLYVFEGCVVKEFKALFMQIEKNVGSVDRVIHLAAQTSVIYSIDYPVEDSMINYKATVEILEYARKKNLKKVIFASSAAVYGDIGSLPIRESQPCFPMSPYGVNKLASEKLLGSYYQAHGVGTQSLRFFNVYGPKQDPKNQYSGVISIFMDKALGNEEITIFGNGEQTRDFIYVEDVASTVVDLLFHRESNGEAFNLGTSQETSINKLAEVILELTGAKSKLSHVEGRVGEIVKSCASIDKLNEFLGQRKKTGIKEGLKHTIDWFKSLS